MAKPPNRAIDHEAIAAVETLLNSHEVRVLGAVGLFVGYLCVLLTKIMNFTQPYIGLLGVVGLTVLLLLLGKNTDARSGTWWLRSFIVIILAIILTSPQLYFAWTVSVAEVQANALQSQSNQVKQLTDKFVKPTITIGPPNQGPPQ